MSNHSDSAPVAAPTPPTGQSASAIASVALGVVSLPAVFCCSFFGVGVPVLGLILGAFAWFDRHKTRRNPGLALAGVILNALVLLALLAVVVWAVVSGDTNVDSLVDRPLISNGQVAGDAGGTDRTNGTDAADAANAADAADGSGDEGDDGDEGGGGASYRWAEQTDAAWPEGCLLEDFGAHRHTPLVAISCTSTPIERETGAVVVFDADLGRVLTTTNFDDYVGFEGGHLEFHRSGTSLITNIGTNGLALINERAEIVGTAYPDETRDHGVNYAWVDHRIYTDTRAFFEIKPGDRRFDFETLDAPGISPPIWNPAARVIVGTVRTSPDGRGIYDFDNEINGFDPVDQTVTYRTDVERGNVQMEWAPDGRFVVVYKHYRKGARYNPIRIYNGDDGAIIATVRIEAESIGKVKWGPEGVLAVERSRYDVASREVVDRHIDFVRDGNVERSIAVPFDVHKLVWSPDGRQLALLEKNNVVHVVEVAEGRVVRSFPTPAPPLPDGLPSGDYTLALPGSLEWVTADRLARFDEHYLTFWTPTGERTAEFIVPMGSGGD